MCIFNTQKEESFHTFVRVRRSWERKYMTRGMGTPVRKKTKEKTVLTETHKRGHNTNMSILFYGYTHIKNLQKCN